jgi:hypothetical protein
MEFRTKRMMWGWGGGVTLYARNGGGPFLTCQLDGQIRANPKHTRGWDHGIFACLLARCESCVDVRLFGDFEFWKSTIN